MNFRLTGIIFGLVLLLVAGLLVSLLVDSGDTAAAPDGLVDPLARAGIKAADVDTVELFRAQPGEEKLLFVKAGDKWELRQPVPAKVDGFAVDNLVRDLFRAAPTRHPELTSNLAVHGLDKPTLRVTLGKGEATASVNLGLTTLGGDRAVTFVTTGAAPARPLAVKRADLASLFRDAARTKDGPAWELARWLPDYRARRPLGADLRDAAADAASLKLSAGGKEVAITKADAGWQFASPAGWGPADELGESQAGPSAAPFTGVRPLLTALTATQIAVEDYLDKPGDPAQYGLADADPNRIRVELAGKTGSPDVLYLGKPVEQNGKPVTPSKVSAKFEGDPAVFTLTFDRLDALRATVANPAALRSRDLLPATAKDKTQAIDLTAGGQTTKLRRLPGEGGAPGKWWVFGGPAGPAEAKAGDVEAILAGLSRPRLATEVVATPDPAAFAPDQVKGSAKLWTDSTPGKSEPGKPPAEPQPKGEPTELTLGRVAGGTATVRRTAGGASYDFLLPADAVQSQLTRPRLSLVDPKIAPFDTAKTTRLLLARGPEPVEVTKDDKGAWTFAQPAAKKGQAADGPRTLNLLGLLANPYVVKLVSDAPTPDELKAWGLEPAGLAATAGPADADKERTVQYGNPAEGDTVYARIAARPLVFTTLKEHVERLKTTELRDHTVYTLDPAKVTRLSVRGYKGAGGPEEYKFEKAAGGWTAVPPTPAGFAPDAAKLDELVKALAAPRAEAFVWLGNKPEFALDPASNPDALQFGIERSDGPPATLVLGAKAGDGVVFGASSGKPGEVFTIKADALYPLAGRPADFRAVTPPPAPPAALPPANPPATPPTKK